MGGLTPKLLGRIVESLALLLQDSSEHLERARGLSGDLCGLDQDAALAHAAVSAIDAPKTIVVRLAQTARPVHMGHGSHVE